MTQVRDAIAAVLDNMSLEQFVSAGGKPLIEDEIQALRA
jgi:flagellar basal body-associated protein FliL